MKSFYIGVLSILCFLRLEGQSFSALMAAGEKSMASKNYYDAYTKFKEALEFDTLDVHVLYKTADAARLLGSYKLSAGYFEKVLKHEQNNLYPNTSFWLGQTRQIQGDYKNAIIAYKAYQTEHSGEDPHLLAIANKEVLACDWAIQQLANPVQGVEIKRLSDVINSPYSDFAPVLWKEQLLYSSLRFENKKSVYIPKRYVSSVLVSEKEGAPEKLVSDTFVEPGLNLAHAAFNKKHNKVYYTICEDINDYDKRCDLYVSNVDANNKWSKGTKLPGNINGSAFTTTQPNLAYIEDKNSEVLYFVSNRPGGKGGLDIYYSYIDSLGNYSEPVNFFDINTNLDDITPFYYERTKTLYYSSKGHLGMGGYDVYSSKEMNEHWSTPKNLGVPINSSFDDVYFVITDKDTLSYFASNRTGTQFLDDATEACCLDLFKIKMKSCDIKLDALVYNFYTKADLLGATVKLYDMDHPNAPPVVITNDKTNQFNYSVLCDKNYKLIGSKQGYTSDTISLYTGQPGEFPVISKKLFLKPAYAQLEVLTFNRNSGVPLNGVTVVLLDLDDPTKPPVTYQSDSSNQYFFSVIPCHRYKLTGAKEDFATTGVNFAVDCGLDGTMTQKLYLPTMLFSFLPVSLYFDNDRPDPSTLRLTTNLAYSSTYYTYYKKKDLFMNNYSKIVGEQPDSVKNAMDVFFEEQIKYGHERFNQFLVVLEKDLKRGKVYEIFVKGYASPLAKSNYNFNLSQRRIVAIYNEFYKYHNGILKKYIKNGQLKLSQKPFGETTAPPGISDNRQDLRSIFTVEASRERRVEIIEIKE